MYYTVLFCTICIITLDSEGFLHEHATSSQLLHTVTLDTAGSHHKSNYLRCYCLTVSFKINKLFSGSARARARTHTHTHTHTYTRTAVTSVLYHMAAGAVPLLLRSPAGTVQRYWHTHTTPYRYALCWSKLHTHSHFSCTTFSSSWPSTPWRWGRHVPLRGREHSPPGRGSVVSPNTGLWVTAPRQPENSEHLFCMHVLSCMSWHAVCCLRSHFSMYWSLH